MAQKSQDTKRPCTDGTKHTQDRRVSVPNRLRLTNGVSYTLFGDRHQLRGNERHPHKPYRNPSPKLRSKIREPVIGTTPYWSRESMLGQLNRGIEN